jgi:hypothetical protein
VAPQLQQDLVNTTALLEVLNEQKTGLDTLFNEGSTAVTQVDQLVTSQAANLGCLLHDSADVLSNIAEPVNLANLSQGLSYNQYFFGGINEIAVPGLAKATTTKGTANPNQLFLRTLLTFPPGSPSPDTYATPNTIPDIYPGAGCVTVYGDGVGPATQPGFVAADGGQVVAPTAAEADVELPGTAASPASDSAAYRVAGQSEWTLLVLGGLLVPALFLVWGARPSRRRARRRA